MPMEACLQQAIAAVAAAVAVGDVLWHTKEGQASVSSEVGFGHASTAASSTTDPKVASSFVHDINILSQCCNMLACGSMPLTGKHQSFGKHENRRSRQT